ncbi:MAG: hypothetical protein H6667_07130 [Ardenticatenaceae bacterium]|nr:hypothetical protein [Ardenticatenaceae bacterium]
MDYLNNTGGAVTAVSGCQAGFFRRSSDGCPGLDAGAGICPQLVARRFGCRFTASVKCVPHAQDLAYRTITVTWPEVSTSRRASCSASTSLTCILAVLPA